MRVAYLLLLLPFTTLAGASVHARRPAASPDRKTVAVLSFTNGSGDSQYDPLGKGIAAMMISDLSNVGSIQLVERERLSDITGEMNLQQSGAVDPATAVAVGKLVGAEYVVTGALTALDPRVHLDTRVIRVQTGEIVKTAQVTGDQKKFFELQQKLAKALIRGLDVALSPEDSTRLEAAQQAERIEDLKVTLKYSEALDLFDRKDYVDAAATMAEVVRAAPESTLMRATYKLMSDRGKMEVRQKGTDKLKGWLHKKIDG